MITGETILQGLENFTYDKVVSKYGKNTALSSVKALFDCLWINFRGQIIYIPTSDGMGTKRRNESIVKDFNGFNHGELSIKYRLSFQAIYSILRKARLENSLKDNAYISTPPKKERPAMFLIIYEYLPIKLVNIGIHESNALLLSENIAHYLCKQFPGVYFCMSDKLRKNHQERCKNINDTLRTISD